jgi:hypothetical protein
MIAVPIVLAVALAVCLFGQLGRTWPNFQSEQKEQSEKQNESKDKPDESKNKSDKGLSEKSKSGQGIFSKNKARKSEGEDRKTE